MSGPHVEKWTYLLVWTQIEGKVQDINYDVHPDSFRLLADSPFSALAMAVSGDNGIKCETYPDLVTRADGPRSVNSNLPGDEASNQLGFPAWKLGKKDPRDLFYVQSGIESRPLGEGDHVRLTGHLVIENGHPEDHSPFLELHPFDYTSIIDIDNPPRPVAPDCAPLQDKLATLKQRQVDLGNELSSTDPPPTAGQRTEIARKLRELDGEVKSSTSDLDACLARSVIPKPQQLLKPSGTFAVTAPLYSKASYSGYDGGYVDASTLRSSISTSLELSYPAPSSSSLTYEEQVLENNTGLTIDQVRRIVFDPAGGRLRVTSTVQSHATPQESLLSQRAVFHARYTFRA